jgi:hypothetical protein
MDLGNGLDLTGSGSSPKAGYGNRIINYWAIYRQFGDFTSILEEFTPEVIPNQKCYMNTRPTLSGYGVVDI